MRRYSVLAVFLSLFALFSFVATTRAGADASKKGGVETYAESEQISPASIVPHRAVYDMKLGTIKNGSSIADVSGQMTFEWADACTGWAVQQRIKLHFSYAQGDESDLESTIVTWESKDGKLWPFSNQTEFICRRWWMVTKLLKTRWLCVKR